jgi:hypothetical protein
MSAPVLLLASAAAPVVDIDGTIFIQAGIFLLLDGDPSPAAVQAVAGDPGPP